MSHPRSSLLVALLAAVPIVQVAFAFAIWSAIPEPQNRGLFGDTFGAMNALFSGLAFAGIVYTILVQRSEITSSASATERAARLSAMSVLVAAYTERARYLDSRASPDSRLVQSYQAKLEKLGTDLEVELALSTKGA
jgi:predicted aspartyl protease